MAEADAEKWNARYTGREAFAHPTQIWIDDVAETDGLELPVHGRALDVGTGTGPLACWAAGRGLHALGVDISVEGLALARRCAARTGQEIETARIDIDDEPLPVGPFAIVTWFHILDASLFERSQEVLERGGWVITEHHTVTNLERHAHPSRRWLVERASMERRARAAGLQIAYAREDWFDGRHVARVIARAE